MLDLLSYRGPQLQKKMTSVLTSPKSSGPPKPPNLALGGFCGGGPRNFINIVFIRSLIKKGCKVF